MLYHDRKKNKYVWRKRRIMKKNRSCMWALSVMSVCVSESIVCTVRVKECVCVCCEAYSASLTPSFLHVCFVFVFLISLCKYAVDGNKSERAEACVFFNEMHFLPHHVHTHTHTEQRKKHTMHRSVWVEEEERRSAAGAAQKLLHSSVCVSAPLLLCAAAVCLLRVCWERCSAVWSISVFVSAVSAVCVLCVCVQWRVNVLRVRVMSAAVCICTSLLRCWIQKE